MTELQEVLASIANAKVRLENRDESFSCHAIQWGATDPLMGHRLAALYSKFIARYLRGSVFNAKVYGRIEPVLQTRLMLVDDFHRALVLGEVSYETDEVHTLCSVLDKEL
jgi:hypothetical protein